jgi:hypothetical protein
VIGRAYVDAMCYDRVWWSAVRLLDSVLCFIAIGEVGLRLIRNETQSCYTKTSEPSEKSGTAAGRESTALRLRGDFGLGAR